LAGALKIRRDHALVEALLKERNRRFGSDYDVDHWPETLNTGRKEVEAIAKDSSGSRLAIEHTLIQPFVGKKADDVPFTRVLGALDKDATLRVPNFMLEVSVDVGSITKGYWDSLGTNLQTWFRNNITSVPEGTSKHAVPETGLTLTVNKTAMKPNVGDYPGRVFVARFAPADTFEAVVRTALESKLPKLLQADAEKRLLLVEKEDCYGSDYKLTELLRRIGRNVSDFARLDEVWLVKTIAWETEGVVWFGPVWPETLIANHGNFCSVNPRCRFERGLL